MKSVAIVGGGVTGLTAAYRLKQKNIAVTLYEAGNRVGGVIKSTRQNGYLAEFGPNSILETSPRIASLVRDLGLENRRLYSAPEAEKRYIVRGAKPVIVPASPLKFFTTELFSASAKFRLVTEIFKRAAPAAAEESVAEFVLRHLGQEFLDYAINPLVAGIYAGDPAKLSVKHGFPKLWDLEQKYGSLILGQILGARERKRRAEVSKQEAKKLSFDEGLQVFTDALGVKLGQNLRLNSAVTAIDRKVGSWFVTTRANGREEQNEHGAVLLSAPAYKLAEIRFASESPVDLTAFKDIHYPPVASLVLGFRREDVAHPLDGFGMLIPAVERFSILGALFSSSLFPNRAPAGHVLLTCYMGGARAPELALLGAEKQFELALKDLGRILGIQGAPTFKHAFVYPKAIPQYEVGYGKFKQLMNDTETKAPGIFFAGHYRDGISLGDSMVSGDNAAERIGNFLSTVA
jgi:protoporphyrinogen/coproporphyrinogen III oxidase